GLLQALLDPTQRLRLAQLVRDVQRDELPTLAEKVKPDPAAAQRRQVRSGPAERTLQLSSQELQHDVEEGVADRRVASGFRTAQGAAVRDQGAPPPRRRAVGFAQGRRRIAIGGSGGGRGDPALTAARRAGGRTA